ncbi:S24 family peptidase [Spirosoma validum]|uniref:DNA repair protein n=1 Tax=Spirosoma validum TaxID=2771355 RepID=A0A927AZH2_9BACT|nr:S24 family peptidase [Spirosoma validum]MBD2752638.1 DNA repair protein [Spirosoma validum]
MIDTIDPIPPENIFRVDPSRRALIPFWEIPVSAGFTSPAENYIQERLNLQDLCVLHPDCTHFVKATGESMTGDYIYPGSILVVDSTIPVETGRVIVSYVNDGWCVKRYVNKDPLVMLESSNSLYAPIYVQPGEVFKILGVVTYIVSKPPKYVRPC